MMLAIHGGEAVRQLPMPARPQYGIEERNAANTVVASGNLSGFLADNSSAFYGGPQVLALEEAWRQRFRVKYAVAMNSATSCLFAAVQAVTAPGDSVVVTPWSMSASATCALSARAVPEFHDIELETYGLGQSQLFRKKPKALVLVHLFGMPAKSLDFYRQYCSEKQITLIEDAAQAPGATWHNKPVGTFGEIGVFSLNRHKQIQAGEGGIAVTDSAALASRLQAIRNHGEILGIPGLFGGNYRMGEVEAAIGKVQLGRLDDLIEPRQRNAEYLRQELEGLEGLRVPVATKFSNPVYYLYPIRVDVGADVFAEALTAEGIKASQYVLPLYKLPTLRRYARVDETDDWDWWYPNVNRAWEETVVLEHIHANMTAEDLNDVVTAIRKVHKHREEL